MPDPVGQESAIRPIVTPGHIVLLQGAAMFTVHSGGAKPSGTSIENKLSLWEERRRLYYLKRIFIFLCLLGVTCMLLSDHFYTKHLNRQRFTLQCNHSETSTDTITPLRDSKTFIIAPYYDNREGKVIRTLGIVHHADVKKLYCYFCCTQEKSAHVSEAKIDIHQDRFGFPFGLADIICEEPPNCKPESVCFDKSPHENISRLTRFKIRNRERGPFTANFTVCISSLYGNHSNVLQFIQTIEMYKLLGAQKVTIYLQNCSRSVEKILDYYVKEGTIEVIPWAIQKYLRPSKNWLYNKDDDKDIGYYGQMSTLNDCIYKNMYKSKFVLLNDIDEIILPFKHQTWDSLMERLLQQYPNTGIFLFEAHAFPQTIVTDGNFSGISSWKDVPGFDILQHVNMEPGKPNWRKMIVDPRMVIQTSVHSVLKCFGSSVEVPLETALVHHCRAPQLPNLNRSSLIDDKTIWKYNASLIRNVNQVLSQIAI